MTQVLIVEDHRAILDHIVENAERIFGPAELTIVTDIDGVSQIPDAARFDMGLIDPGLPGIPHDQIKDRIDFILPLARRITSPARVAVFTGIATDIEQDHLRAEGVVNYFSKADTGVEELVAFFSGNEPEATLPPPLDTTWSFLSPGELEALKARTTFPNRTYEDLAHETGKSTGAFSQSLKRARRKLREFRAYGETR